MTGGKGKRTFVGFGFGPIQSGLFLLEASLSGNFSRFVVAEIDPGLVSGVRAGGNRYTVNVARADHVDQITVQSVELYDPREGADRARLVEAIAESSEMATALPSVQLYDVGGQAGPAGVIAEGLARRSGPMDTIIYAAENHNRAAERLAHAIARLAGAERLAQVQTLNTVIGKMSGVIDDERTIERLNLATITPDIPRAILVEQFNRILISRITLPLRRGVEVFIEKDDLLPFEEAKLYGHNAVHALIGYLAEHAGLETIAQAGRDAWIMAAARKAFIDESGPALIQRHAGVGDPLFTPQGYRAYAEDLLERMICPFLNDLVSRVTRDHLRKLGYGDRLYGTMRLCLDAGLQPTNLALGAAAAVLSIIARRDEVHAPLHLPASSAELTEEALSRLLCEIWGQDHDRHAQTLIKLTWDALHALPPRRAVQ